MRRNRLANPVRILTIRTGLLSSVYLGSEALAYEEKVESMT
jgi:hypothetical protein